MGIGASSLQYWQLCIYIRLRETLPETFSQMMIKECSRSIVACIELNNMNAVAVDSLVT